MSTLFPNSVFTDSTNNGNKYEVNPDPNNLKQRGELGAMLGTSGFISTGVTSAAAGTYTLAAATGYHVKLEGLEIGVAGFTGEGSSATVHVTLYSGAPTTTPLAAMVFSKNGHFDQLLEGITCTSASGSALVLTHSAGATGVTVATTMKGKYVKA